MEVGCFLHLIMYKPLHKRDLAFKAENTAMIFFPFLNINSVRTKKSSLIFYIGPTSETSYEENLVWLAWLKMYFVKQYLIYY